MIGRHEWFRDTSGRTCPACGAPDCTGRIAVEFCPLWQQAEARTEYLPTYTLPGRWGDYLWESGDLGTALCPPDCRHRVEYVGGGYRVPDPRYPRGLPYPE